MVTLQEFLVTGVFAFMLCFARMGTALLILPGIGDTFVPARVRLYIALAMSFALYPLMIGVVPNPLPNLSTIFMLILFEIMVGLFFGTIARIFMSALDTAGMAISFNAGLANAQLFNPGSAAQGSLFGAFLSITGTVFIFQTNLHHLLIIGLVESYTLFPLGTIPDAGSMAELVSRAVAASFAAGIAMAAPFMVVTLLVYVGMGILSRLMPQIQVFLIALPLQILLSIVTLALVFSTMMMYWIAQFEEGMVFFLSVAQ